MSTFHHPHTSQAQDFSILRKQKNPFVAASARECPEVAIDYGKYMGGVDDADRLRAFFTLRRPSRKWWWAVFTFILDTAMQNAWFVFGRIHGGVDRGMILSAEMNLVGRDEEQDEARLSQNVVRGVPCARA